MRAPARAALPTTDPHVGWPKISICRGTVVGRVAGADSLCTTRSSDRIRTFEDAPPSFCGEEPVGTRIGEAIVDDIFREIGVF